MAAVGKSDGGRLEFGAFAKADRILALGMAGHVRKTQRVIGALQRKTAICIADVFRLGLQQLGRKRAAGSNHLVGDALPCRSTNRHCARTAVAAPVREIVDIAGPITVASRGMPSSRARRSVSVVSMPCPADIEPA